jgi:hypothetical protein
MEWVLYGRRIRIAVILVGITLAGVAFAVVYAIAIDSLSPTQQAVYVQREEEEVNGRWAPLFGKIQHRDGR